MSEVTVSYQVMTDGENYRIRSIVRQHGWFRTYTTYQWESYAPFDKSYEECADRIKRLFGEAARIEYRIWRPA